MMNQKLTVGTNPVETNPSALFGRLYSGTDSGFEYRFQTIEENDSKVESGMPAGLAAGLFLPRPMTGVGLFFVRSCLAHSTPDQGEGSRYFVKKPWYASSSLSWREPFGPFSLGGDLTVVATDASRAVCLSESAQPSTWTDEGFETTFASTKLSNFASRISVLLESEPVEDGVEHPAESLIADARLEFGATSFWQLILLVYRRFLIGNPLISASVLRCLARLSCYSANLNAYLLVQNALTHPSAELREAAVRCLEHWGGRRAQEILGKHVAKETAHWLAEYVRQVLLDLEPAVVEP